MSTAASACSTFASESTSTQALPPITELTTTPGPDSTVPSRDLWVDDCVRYVERGAYSGNDGLRSLLELAERGPATLRDICERYHEPDFSGLEQLAP